MFGITAADVYIAGFVATAITLMVRYAWPRINAGVLSPGLGLTAVYLVAFLWFLWLPAEVARVVTGSADDDV